MTPDQHIEKKIGTPAIKTHRLLFNPSAAGLPSEFPFRTVYWLLPLIKNCGVVWPTRTMTHMLPGVAKRVIYGYPNLLNHKK